MDKTGRFRFFDTSGRILDLGDFHEGYARVLVRGADGVGRWGYLDRGYALRIPPRYEDARDFHGGSAAVKRDGRWGYIDKADRVRVGFAYEAADDFDGVLAMVSVTQTVEAKVKAGAGVGVEDGADLRGGKEQPPGRAGETSGGWGGVGFVDKTGQRGIAPVFAWGESLAQRWVRVALTPNFGYLDVSGRLWWDPRAPAQRGIIDTRRGARARAVASRTGVGDPLLPLPPLRETELPPYPPEYTYVEVLPVGWDPDPAD